MLGLQKGILQCLLLLFVSRVCASESVYEGGNTIYIPIKAKKPRSGLGRMMNSSKGKRRKMSRLSKSTGKSNYHIIASHDGEVNKNNTLSYYSSSSSSFSGKSSKNLKSSAIEAEMSSNRSRSKASSKKAGKKSLSGKSSKVSLSKKSKKTKNSNSRKYSKLSGKQKIDVRILQPDV